MRNMFSHNYSSVSMNHIFRYGDKRYEPHFHFKILSKSLKMDVGLWNNWLLMALLTPALWAVSCVIDTCFVGERIFRDPSDGPVISGLFCVLPLFTAFSKIDGWEVVTASATWPALLAGVCYFLHLYFVFRALFSINDASCSETFNTLTVFFVPILAFLLLGERLRPIYYVAILLALTGILLLIRYHLSGVPRRAIAFLMIAVLSISLSMVLQAWVFDHMPYWNGVLLFSVGTFLTALLVFSVQRTRRVRLVRMCRRYGPIFLIAELLQLAAVLASQRATDIGPSVSFVAVIESSLPLFIMLFSAVSLAIFHRWRTGFPQLYETLVFQTMSASVKLVSLTFIIGAIVLVQMKIT